VPAIALKILAGRSSTKRDRKACESFVGPMAKFASCLPGVNLLAGAYNIWGADAKIGDNAKSLRGRSKKLAA
jgi:hypothetical protein